MRIPTATHGPVCARLISGRRSGHDAVVSHGAPGQSPRFVRRSVFGMGVPFCTRFVPFFPPPAPPCGGPCFARIARGRARPSAPARFARLIARARGAYAGRTSPVRSVGFFSRRREAAGEAARGCRFLLCHSTTDILRSSRFGNYFLPIRFVPPEVRPPTPPPSSRSRLLRVPWRRVRGIPARRRGGRA